MKFVNRLILASLMAMPGVGVSSLVAAEPPQKMDTAFVPQEAFAAVVAHPRRVLTAAEWQLMPIEVLSAGSQQELGVDVLNVEQVLAVIGWPDQGEPPLGAVVRFARPYDRTTTLAKLLGEAEERSVGERKYLYAARLRASVCFVDPQTIVLGTDSMVRKMLAAEEVTSPLTRLLSAADVSADLAAFVAVDAVREQIKPLLGMLPPLPPPLKGLRKLPELIKSIELQTQLAAGSQQLIFRAENEPAAIEAQEILNKALAFGKQMALANLPPMSRGNDQVQQALQRYFQRLSDHVVEMLQPKRDGSTLKIAGESVGGAAQAGLLVGLLLPAVNNARESGRRAVSMNNLRNLAFAMMNYENAHNQLPPRCSYTPEGKPLLSWRVHLLPSLDRPDLYRQFHLDEPWDSPHNKQLISLMPEILRSPNDARDASEGKTLYQVPVAQGTIFAGKKPLPLSRISDGLGNTILVVEADPEAAVIWTKPDDLKINLERPLEHLGHLRPLGFLASMADGSTRMIEAGRGEEAIKALFTAQGGEPDLDGN